MFKHDQYSVLSLTQILQTQTTLLSQSEFQDEFYLSDFVHNYFLSQTMLTWMCLKGLSQ